MSKKFTKQTVSLKKKNQNNARNPPCCLSEQLKQCFLPNKVAPLTICEVKKNTVAERRFSCTYA